MTTTLHYTYGPTGRERIEYTCSHGTTILRGAELFYTPDGFAAMIVRHRARLACLCDPERMIRFWPYARDALRQFEAMVVDVPPELDALDLNVTLTDLVELRRRVPCPGGCALSWTATSEVGGKLSRQYRHGEGCLERSVTRPTHSTISRKPGLVS